MEFEDIFADNQPGAPEGDAEEEEGVVSAEQLDALNKAPNKPRRAVKKRPKLNLETLQLPNGLQEVFDTFPKYFQEGYSGKGHEVRDLRRLLGLYQRWQVRLFSAFGFNQFEAACEKLSGTHALKVHLQDMRAKLPDLVDPRREDEEGQQLQEEQAHAAGDGDDQQQQQDQRQHGPGPSQHQQQQRFDDIDDDELLDLQNEEAMDIADQMMDELVGQHNLAPQAAAAGAGTQPRGSPAAGVGVEAGATAAAGGRAPLAAKRSVRDWSDDDDEERLARPRQQQQRRQQQQQQLVAQLLEDMMDDDDVDDGLGLGAAAAAGAVGSSGGGGGGGGARRRRAAALSDDDDEEEDDNDLVLAAGGGAARGGDRLAAAGAYGGARVGAGGRATNILIDDDDEEDDD